MKSRAAILVVVISAFAAAAWYFHSQEGHFVFNRQVAGIVLFKGHYRSYMIWYAQGEMIMPDGSLKTLWTFPEYHHLDIDYP